MSDHPLDNYRLLGPLGEGAAGQVYLGTPVNDTAFARAGNPVAIKRYKPTILAEVGQMERIRREFNVGAGLAHPNLVRMFDYSSGEKGDRPFLVMEYVDGKPLSSWIPMFYPVPAHVILRLVEGIAGALVTLHDANIQHRDIKPSNIAITTTLDAKLMDLGVVRISDREVEALTPKGKFLGTIRNAAPEMLRGESYDLRADLYSLGTVLYALLHGYEVFSDEHNWTELVHLVRNAHPVFDEAICRGDPLCHELCGLTKQLMAKDAARRPSSAKAVMDRLADLRGQVPASHFEPLNAYVATALTQLDPDSNEAMAFLSSRIADVSKAYDIYVYQPRKATDPLLHPNVDSAIVYATDRARVADADLLFLVANKPSFGVGQEIEIAASYGKPIILLARQGTHVSRMVLGSFTNILGPIYYETPENLENELRKVLRGSIGEIRAWARRSRHSIDLKTGHNVAALRGSLGYASAQDFAKAIQLPPRLLEAIEVGKLDNVGIWLLAYIARGLKVSVNQLVAGEAPGTQGMSTKMESNLRKLEAVARKIGLPAAEYFELRDDFKQEVAASGRTFDLSESDWIDRREALVRRKLREAGIEASTSGDQGRFL